MEPNEPLRYTVSVLQPARERLGQLRMIAIRNRMPQALTDDLAAVWERLQTDPLSWGDPLYDYHQLGMTVQRGQSPFLFVYYCVNEVGRAVFIRRVEPYQYGPLA